MQEYGMGKSVGSIVKAAVFPAIAILLLMTAGCTGTVVRDITSANTMPVSKEASLVESVSPAEVMIEAVGKGMGPDKQSWLGLAVQDARRTAVWYVLHMPVDPLLQTEAEVRKFAFIEPGFYSDDNLGKYITWESEIEGVVLSLMENGRVVGKQVTMRFKINKEALMNDLVSMGIITGTEELAEELGNPMIMVLPDIPKGADLLSFLGEARFRTAAVAAESYLSARRYDVIVPEAENAIDQQVRGQQMIAGVADDPSYGLALATGSDIYLKCSVRVERGSYGTKKASVAIRAYETTTARLLGSSSGFSKARPSAESVVIEEATHDAIDKVLSRIDAYWKTDLEKGVQYRVIASISDSFEKDKIENIQFSLSDLLGKACEKKKELVLSGSTADFVVWVDRDEYSSASELYRFIKKNLPKIVPGVSVSRLSLNRKLIVMEID